MQLSSKIATLTTLCLLTACAHHNNVRPSSDGNHYINLYGETKENVADDAFKQAKSYCDESEHTPFVVSEKIDYVGSIDESEYLNKRNVAKAVETAGTAMWILGDSHVDDAGAVMSIGGDIAADALGKPYHLHLVFNCN